MFTKKMVQHENPKPRSLWRAFYNMLIFLFLISISYFGLFSAVNEAQACVCGDGEVESPEICEIGYTQDCTTSIGYTGKQTCLATTCEGFNACVSLEKCGDNIKNGNEQCDGPSDNYPVGSSCNSNCSFSCISGYHFNESVCVVDKPAETYSWVSGDFSACTATCGGGTQTRDVSCVSSTKTTVADALCTGTKPEISQVCNTPTCVSNSGGGGGGGGGGGYIAFNISNPQLTMQCSPTGLVDVTLTWLSSYSANSRVLYGTTSHSMLGSAPNYGYTNSSALSSGLVTGHSVAINGLNSNTVYYFRPVSVYNSNEILGEEKIMTQTLACSTGNSEIIVLGEEGAPILGITNQSLLPFVNQGAKDVEYKITVTNNGDLTSFSTILTNLLPDGLTYSDDGTQTKTWNLGDIIPGETKTIMVKVDVATNAKLQNYISIASANSTNHDAVSDEADLDVRGIFVLAETGFSWLQLILLLSLIAGAAGLRRYLNRRLSF